ncbi:Apoptosis antagonizing transcription factor/protein transport protein [Handroanthus impetiginosus]|uniref:Apoptosis antagonizing transcription factor/protein transport protein n=1 Tax=Handroanthus impetiginosus TaxID=429701 RepID=A0A2G9IBM7_9LAMI|nr:Apoptosis antagonizing transcription factor/protein transport protein [Handroanthus impetiginosus]
MGKKKSRKMGESDNDLGFDDDIPDRNIHVDYDDDDDDNYFHDEDKDDQNDYDDDDDEEDEEEEDGGQGEEEEGSGEDTEEGAHDDDEEVQKGEELEELEKEYRELRNEEQDIWRNLKHQKDEDLQKGQAVKNQRALWDKTLELRFLVQKAFSSSNRLPQEPVRSLFCDTDSRVSEAYSDLIASSKKTLDSILELQQALLDNNPSIIQSGEANSVRDTKQSQASGYSNGEIDEEWLPISQMQSRMASFRNKSIDKWQRKTQVTTGAAAIKDKLHAFNQSISEQVAGYMRDPSKMIKGMQQNRSAVAVFGTVPESTDSTKQEEPNANGDPELLDDSEFYQQLLKEFFETIDPSSSETAFYALKRLQTKKRKIVDRRASKSRKIRYHVHEKIVNFMAPRPMNLPPMAPKLFENLFGLKTQKPALGA